MNNEKMTDSEVAAIREELNKIRVTEWLHPTGRCGCTSYECNTNRGWLNCDLKRLKSHGVKAAIITFDGMSAIFRIGDGETEQSIVEKLRKIGGVKTEECA